MWLLEMLFGPRVPTITVEEAEKMWRRGEAVLVDVRERRELNATQIPGAVHVALSELRRRVPDLPKDKPILCICRSGHRSIPAARRLMKAGYTQVYSVKGGLRAWQRRGLPVKSK